MKELSIEEKAKAYDGNYKTYTELINRLEDVKNAIKKQNYGIAMDILCKPYPEYQITTSTELKESEDEEVRKSLIGHLKECRNNTRSEVMLGEYAKWIAWLEEQGEHANFLDKIQIGDKVTRNEDGVLVNLSQLNRVAEKQGEHETLCDKCRNEQPSHSCQDITALGRCAVEHEQKPSDKVEPKFKIGDWIIYDGWTTQIKEVYEDGYSNIHRGFIPKDREDSMRLWTIQDAKDGDVVVVDNVIFMYKRVLANHIVSYCRLIDDVFESTSDARTCCEGNTYVHPATKEQRDLLFNKMHEAGYEWDAEKKELKKIEQKSSWSEEDEKTFSRICGIIHHVAYQNCDTDEDGNELGEYARIINWFKFLKDRVQPQPKQEWSEEDNKKLIEGLKSLRPQKQWKPSDEQMFDLKCAADSNANVLLGQSLLSLYNDLKKLKG